MTTPNGPVDYHKAVTGGLRLVPASEQLDQLAEDYGRIVKGRLPHGESAPTFAELMESCGRIADATNEVIKGT